MDNQVDDATVDSLVQAVRSRYDLVARYYRLKRKLLGLPELLDYDRYAPLASEEKRASWEEAKEIVLAAYGKFDPKMAQIASLFFEKGWIDASVHPGKRGGAFCAATIPSLHPYVHAQLPGQVGGCADPGYELGHGVHQYLSRPQGALSWSTPLTTAETASIFGETLVFQDLLAREKDPRARLSLLVRRIESSFATVFRQVAMNRFEDAAHKARAEGELPTERLCELWLSTQREMFGDSVTLSDDYGSGGATYPTSSTPPGTSTRTRSGTFLFGRCMRAIAARARAFPVFTCRCSLREGRTGPTSSSSRWGSTCGQRISGCAAWTSLGKWSPRRRSLQRLDFREKCSTIGYERHWKETIISLKPRNKRSVS